MTFPTDDRTFIEHAYTRALDNMRESSRAIIYLVPRGKPDCFCAWHDKTPKAVKVSRETPSDWYGRPIANPACGEVEIAHYPASYAE